MTKLQAHGIMFHHFFSKKHPKGQGAISATQLTKIIKFIGRKRIISASEWLDRVENNALRKHDVCFTFDDALLCQYEVALPVLEHFSIKAFWFIYTSVLEDEIEMFEIYRKFRSVFFPNFDIFYKAFLNTVNKSKFGKTVEEKLLLFKYQKYLKEFPFYSENDKKFRYIRDELLRKSGYNLIMKQMLNNFKVDIKRFSSNLWMKNYHLKRLHSTGHVIGLHSHTHPMLMNQLTYRKQLKEYATNADVLTRLLGDKPQSMSHPRNSYNPTTLKILKKLGIRVGFLSNMASGTKSKLELPREDHANIIKLIYK